MKKRTKLVVLQLLVFLMAVCVFGVSLSFADGSVSTYGLFAGKDQYVGLVSVWEDGENLYVQYQTNDGWAMTETHLAIAGRLDGIPQKNGNPIPGKFPYSQSYDPAVTSDLYIISLSDLQSTDFIAAHAVVIREGTDYETETAWGSQCDGQGGYKEFPGKNWARYFEYPFIQ